MFAIGANGNIWEQVNCTDPGIGGVGLDLGTPVFDGILDVAQNLFTRCYFQGYGASDGDGIVLRYTDNCVFFHCTTSLLHVSSGPRGAKGIRPVPPDGDPNTPTETTFYHCPIIGGVHDPLGVWSTRWGLTFLPYPVLDGEPVPTHPACKGVTSTGKPFGGFASANGRDTMIAGNTTPIGSVPHKIIEIHGPETIVCFGNESDGAIIGDEKIIRAITPFTIWGNPNYTTGTPVNMLAGDIVRALYIGNGIWAISTKGL